MKNTIQIIGILITVNTGPVERPAFYFAVAAAAAQPRPDGARLSTSQRTAAQPRPYGGRATAAKTQPQFSKSALPRLKPSLSLTLLCCVQRSKKSAVIDCRCVYVPKLSVDVSVVSIVQQKVQECVVHVHVAQDYLYSMILE